MMALAPQEFNQTPTFAVIIIANRIYYILV